jgi:SAM-dependent methyltransferase
MKSLKIVKYPFDKYELYSEAVQSVDTDVDFYLQAFREIRGSSKKPTTLREDFCAAGLLCKEWVSRGKNQRAVGLDLDEEPMQYGREHYLDDLSEDQRGRVLLVKKNVLDRNLPKANIICAVNFSYYIFKSRDLLGRYFRSVQRSLKKDGLFIVDCFGGSQCYDEIEDRTKKKGFIYYWEQKSFDPISNEAKFSINFRYKGKKYNDVFTYDWRMWTIPEIRELMIDSGFKQTTVYWEGTTRSGGGNGEFTQAETGEACLSWIAYIVAEK